jgi:hypothetical protein
MVSAGKTSMHSLKLRTKRRRVASFTLSLIYLGERAPNINIKKENG